jgi:parallel beta-helix repeat protein
MRTVRAAITYSACLLILGTSLMAATVQVGRCRAGITSFSTIQSAVNASAAGGEVLVCPGRYPEQIEIRKNLSLRGVQSGTLNAAVVVPPSSGVVQNTSSLATGNPIAAQILVNEAADVTIENLTIDGAHNGISTNGCINLNLVGILYQNASGTVNHVTAFNQALSGNAIGCQVGMGIFVQSGNGGTSTVAISNSHVAHYQKNGITGNEIGTTVTISGNTVVGQGPTKGAAENSIQIGYGAKGKVSANVAMDDIFAPEKISDSGNAASGILVFAPPGITVSQNTVGNTQFGIAFVSDSASGSADGGTIDANKITATHIFDGLDVCSSSNTVTDNTIFGSDEAGIHLDSSCGAVANNKVSANTVNNACAGVMVGTGAGANTIGSNAFFNTRNTILTANQCTPPLSLLAGGNIALSAKSLHGSPARP